MHGLDLQLNLRDCSHTLRGKDTQYVCLFVCMGKQTPFTEKKKQLIKLIFKSYNTKCSLLWMAKIHEMSPHYKNRVK